MKIATALGTWTLTLFLAVSVSGCAELPEVKTAKAEGEGTSVSYPVTRAEAWAISRAVFAWEDVDHLEEHPDEGCMLASFDMDAFSWGSFAGVWIEPGRRGLTNVTVVTKRKLAVNAVTRLTETTFHDDFAKATQIVRSGKPLPAEKPD
jgi:hypothetical protein